MKRILVPSDLSEISENALKVAVDIADKADAEIFLVNFTEHPKETFTATGEADKKYADEENIMTIHLVKRLQQDLSVLATKYSTGRRKINFQVYDHELKDGIVEYIEEYNIDLVVMGTSGEESADEFFSGNHTEQVIEVATCPVISVKNDYVKSQYDRIVLGLDTEKDSKDNFSQAASYLNDLADSLGARIDIVNIVKPGTSDKVKVEKELTDFSSRFGIKDHSVTIVESDDKEKGLIDFAKSRSAGLLAVFSHAEDGFFRIFRDNLSEELSMHSDVPVLIINLHKV